MHIPVLQNAAIAALRVSVGSLYLDGTFGGGGYSKAILASGGKVLALDCDPSVEQNLIDNDLLTTTPDAASFNFIAGKFGDIARIAETSNYTNFAGIVLDLGVSSMQLDSAERGFSFQYDGPLDMRMSGQGITAADLVNNLPQETLRTVLNIYGEERYAKKITEAIAKQRQSEEIQTTRQLTEIITAAIPMSAQRSARINPATRTFQALRIVVNDEIGELARALRAAELLLKPEGVMAVVSFHSLEDRLVKGFFADTIGHKIIRSRHLPENDVDNRPFIAHSNRAVMADDHEVSGNPRARSGRLRWAARTTVPYREREPKWPLAVILAAKARAMIK